MQSILDQWVKMNRVMIFALEAKKGDEISMGKCDVCSCEFEEEKIKHVHIKGKQKKICEECIAAIKGFA